MMETESIGSITEPLYLVIMTYIMDCAIGAVPINPSRLQVCQWIVERVKDGTITVTEDA